MTPLVHDIVAMIIPGVIVLVVTLFTSEILGLALDTLSSLAELNARRTMALTQTVPLAIMIALAITAAVAMGWVGCGIGLGPRRNLAMSVILSVLFGLIVAFVIDLDQPQHGIIRSNQEPLIELRDALQAREAGR